MFLANVLSVKLAVAISGLLLSPALFFIRRVDKQTVNETDSIAEPSPAD